MLGSVMKPLMVLATVFVVGAPECMYDTSPPIATIGEEMVIMCNLEMCFGSNDYRWCKVNGTNCDPQSTTSRNLTVSDNVAVAEVGGQIYKCHCSNNPSNCRKYKIAVTPNVNLSLSTKVARSGSSVSVTCMAESYPPADSVENYIMTHPRDKNITRMLLPSRNGVFHVIQAASKEDAGEYGCIVMLTLSEYSFQSGFYKVTLTVYDPPNIVSVSNFTVACPGQLAVLQCVVNSTEQERLEVWVNWTTGSGEPVTQEHATAQDGNVFYLLLYNTTQGPYECLLFSLYSAQEPEHRATATVETESETCDYRSSIVTTEPKDATNLTLESTASIVLFVISAILAIIGIATLTIAIIRRYLVTGGVRVSNRGGNQEMLTITNPTKIKETEDKNLDEEGSPGGQDSEDKLRSELPRDQSNQAEAKEQPPFPGSLAADSPHHTGSQSPNKHVSFGVGGKDEGDLLDGRQDGDDALGDQHSSMQGAKEDEPPATTIHRSRSGSFPSLSRKQRRSSQYEPLEQHDGANSGPQARPPAGGDVKHKQSSERTQAGAEEQPPIHECSGSRSSNKHVSFRVGGKDEGDLLDGRQDGDDALRDQQSSMQGAKEDEPPATATHRSRSGSFPSLPSLSRKQRRRSQYEPLEQHDRANSGPQARPPAGGDVKHKQSSEVPRTQAGVEEEPPIHECSGSQSPNKHVSFRVGGKDESDLQDGRQDGDDALGDQHSSMQGAKEDKPPATATHRSRSGSFPSLSRKQRRSSQYEPIKKHDGDTNVLQTIENPASLAAAALPPCPSISKSRSSSFQ